MSKNNYNKTVDELYKEFNTSISGLSSEEAERRYAEYGANKLR